MIEDDWKRLCKSIHERNCILVLGSEFPIELVYTGEETTCAQLLIHKLVHEIVGFERLPDVVLQQTKKKELSQLALDYINYKGVDKKISRDDLEWLLSGYMNEKIKEIRSEYFKKLLSLPFTCIINTNYFDFSRVQPLAPPKTSQHAYFNFRCEKTDTGNTGSPDFPLTEMRPLIYNFFGSIDEPSSLVISDNDLIELAIKIISGNTGLPYEVKAMLADHRKNFLFVGLPLSSKVWYFNTLFQFLECNNKRRMSYAIEAVTKFKYDEPDLFYFRDELKISLLQLDPKEFIDSLLLHYKTHFSDAQIITIPENAPKVFISYKREDYARTNEICQRLKTLGINAWIDKDRLKGDWQTAIISEIANSDAFILIQSSQLKNNPITYVNVEIKEALKKARFYTSESDFIFPCFIDCDTSILTGYPAMSAIHSFDLTKDDKIDVLAREIRKSFERNHRKPAP